VLSLFIDIDMKFKKNISIKFTRMRAFA